MASWLIIEQESGTVTRRRHPRNGYYAGDFWSNRPAVSLTPSELTAD